MPTFAAVFPFIGSAVLLGLGLPLSRVAAGAGVATTAFAFWPTIAAGLVLALLAWRRRGPIALDAKLVRFGLVSGVVGHALPVSASLWLAANAESALVAAAFALPPLFTLLVAMLVGQQRATWRHAAAIAIGLAAALGVAAGGQGGSSISVTEAALALLMPILIGSANVYRAIHLPSAVPSEWLGAKMLLWSSAAMAAIGWQRGELALSPEPAPLGWIALQTLSLVGGYLLYFVLQRRAGPVAFSFIGYGMLLTGIAAAAALFGEWPAPDVVPALAVVAGALWWLNAASAAQTILCAGPDPCAVCVDAMCSR
jgi:drug/metabolite transporter (DMT)-like permease